MCQHHMNENTSWQFKPSAFFSSQKCCYSLVLKRLKYSGQINMSCRSLHDATWMMCGRELMFTLKPKRHLYRVYFSVFPSTFWVIPCKGNSYFFKGFFTHWAMCTSGSCYIMILFILQLQNLCQLVHLASKNLKVRV